MYTEVKIISSSQWLWNNFTFIGRCILTMTNFQGIFWFCTPYDQSKCQFTDKIQMPKVGWTINLQSKFTYSTRRVCGPFIGNANISTHAGKVRFYRRRSAVQTRLPWRLSETMDQYPSRIAFPIRNFHLLCCQGHSQRASVIRIRGILFCSSYTNSPQRIKSCE